MCDNICTIPITDAFSPKKGCPICRMKDMIEKKAVSYILGEAMMECSVRIETNKIGFCGKHYNDMLNTNNRLSLALILQTHLQELNETNFNDKKITGGLFNKKTVKLAHDSVNQCYLCNQIESSMKNMYKTMTIQWSSNEEFRKLYSEQPFICLSHYQDILQYSQNIMSQNVLNQFFDDTKKLTKNYLQTLYDDISYYCSMYDYRNKGKNFGNSKDSIERSIDFLSKK